MISRKCFVGGLKLEVLRRKRTPQTHSFDSRKCGFRWTAATGLARRRTFSCNDLRRYTPTMMGERLENDHRLLEIARRTAGREMLDGRQCMAGWSGRDRRRFHERAPILIDFGHAAHLESRMEFNDAMIDFGTNY